MENLTIRKADWSGAADEAVKACEAAAKSGTAEACAEAARLSWGVWAEIPDCLRDSKDRWAKGARYWDRRARNGGREG
jgi:hypothetical protein